MSRDAKQLMVRFRSALQLQQRCNMGRPIMPKDRGLLIAALSLLYHPEENEARAKINKAKEKRRAEAMAAAAETADAAAMAAMFDDGYGFGSMDAAQEEDSAAAAATAAAEAVVGAPLPRDCQVCFSEFGSEWEGVTTVRVRSSLCGHASLCAECFATYLAKRIEADDVVPFLPCPEPHCKLPLAHVDIVAAVPSNHAAAHFEAEFKRQRENAVRRNKRAMERKQQRHQQHSSPTLGSAAAVDPVGVEAAIAARHHHSDSSDDGCDSNDINKRSKSASRKRTPSRAHAAAGGSPAGAASRRRSSATSRSSTGQSSEDDDEQSRCGVNIVPQAPPVSAPQPPLLPTPLLLQLVLLHLHRALMQCREWVPCGSHPLSDEQTPSADEIAAAADSANVAAIPAGDIPAAAVASAVSGPRTASVISVSPSEPAAAPTAPKAACRFGFVVAPAWASPASSQAKDKLKKCEMCGVLQCVRPAAGSASAGATDDSVAAMIAGGVLRACPQCEALQMKDRGMCNVLQCHSCQIWWNWSSRATGKNPAALKEQARRNGTMWEAGELQYQLTLQREDPEAFKQLLQRNGIDYNPNYVRGFTK